MTELEQAIQAIEHGLLPVKQSGEHPAGKIEPDKRMAHYKAPGISIAFMYREELVWLKSFSGRGGELHPQRPNPA